MASHLKMNQLHLNIIENFDRLKKLSRPGMFRHEDILEVDDWCKQHFVDLIPVISQSFVRETASPDIADDIADDIASSSIEQNSTVGNRDNIIK